MTSPPSPKVGLRLRAVVVVKEARHSVIRSTEFYVHLWLARNTTDETRDSWPVSHHPVQVIGTDPRHDGELQRPELVCIVDTEVNASCWTRPSPVVETLHKAVSHAKVVEWTLSAVITPFQVKISEPYAKLESHALDHQRGVMAALADTSPAPSVSIKGFEGPTTNAG